MLCLSNSLFNSENNIHKKKFSENLTTAVTKALTLLQGGLLNIQKVVEQHPGSVWNHSGTLKKNIYIKIVNFLTMKLM